MPAGRPTKYSKELLKKTKAWVAEFDIDDAGTLPSVERLALHLGCSRDSIYEWAKHEDKKEFSDTLRELEYKQKIMLVDGGLSGAKNTTITKLMLSSNHGVNEKTETDLKASVAVSAIKLIVVDPKSE